MASFHLIIKIPSRHSPSSFNYSIAACSKHAARFLTCTGDRTHISHPLHVLYPSYWFPRQFCIDFIFIFQCLLSLSFLFFWALRTLDFSLFHQVIQLGFMCDPLLPLWGLCDPGWSPNILIRMTFISNPNCLTMFWYPHHFSHHESGKRNCNKSLLACKPQGLTSPVQTTPCPLCHCLLLVAQVFLSPCSYASSRERIQGLIILSSLLITHYCGLGFVSSLTPHGEMKTPGCHWAIRYHGDFYHGRPCLIWIP